MDSLLKFIDETPQLRSFLEQAVAIDASPPSPHSLKKLQVELGDLWLLGVAALWQILRIGVQHLRSMSENSTLTKRAGIVRELVDAGYSQTTSAHIVDQIVRRIRSLPSDDPVVSVLENLTPGGDASTRDDV